MNGRALGAGLFQFMTELVVLVTCSHLPHVTSTYAYIIQIGVPLLCST